MNQETGFVKAVGPEPLDYEKYPIGSLLFLLPYHVSRERERERGGGGGRDRKRHKKRMEEKGNERENESGGEISNSSWFHII